MLGFVTLTIDNSLTLLLLTENQTVHKIVPQYTSFFVQG